MTNILIVGGASIDTLHLSGGTVVSPGGAGLYTALAAIKSGATVDLFGPRPLPMPSMLAQASRLFGWLGPRVSPSQLARFEISYQGGEATYLKTEFGREGGMEPEMLPPDLSGYDGVHLVPLGDAQRQLLFLWACRGRLARFISAGTQLQIILEKPDVVAEVMRSADIFFMNEAEAVALFGSLEAAAAGPGKLLVVTRGAAGALIIQGDRRTSLPAVAVETVDPTGAGDAFCGAALAHLLHGDHPVMAARRAMPCAAHTLTRKGPDALLEPGAPPEPPGDQRAAVNRERVARVASLIAELDEVIPFDFTGPDFPPVGHPQTLDWFFAVTLQQFGFWTTQDGRYHAPLLAPIDGSVRKGSSYFFRAYRRALEIDAGFCSPKRQAGMAEAELRSLLRADDGTDPAPAFELHLDEARRYGRDMKALKLTPAGIMALMRRTDRPLARFLSLLDQVSGYKEDPLRKKSGLLALILNQRPERFLTFGEGEQMAPVIDYHLMRSCLRTGLVDVEDESLRERLAGRVVLEAGDEWAVRYASYLAVEAVTAVSGKGLGAVDYFFFGARSRCPEMTEPQCDLCPLESVCAQRKALFQPVIRTTYY